MAVIKITSSSHCYSKGSREIFKSSLSNGVADPISNLEWNDNGPDCDA